MLASPFLFGVNVSETNEAIRLKEYLQGRFSKQKKMIEAMRKLRALLHEVKVPDEYATTTQAVRTPIMADMIQRIVATLTVNNPTWQRGLMGDRPNDEKASSRIEKWISGAHIKMELQAHRRTFRMLMDAAVADGMAVCQYQWSPHAWSPFPRRNEAEKADVVKGPDAYRARVNKHVRQKPFPFTLRDIDPLNYYFWDGYDGEREVMLIETVPLAPTAARLNVRYEDKQWVQGNAGQPEPGNTLSGESVELMQHWKPSSVTYYLDDKFAKKIDLKGDRLGIFDFAGLSTHERAPERAFLPVAFALTELIPFLDRLLTMKSNWMYLVAFPRGILRLSEQHLNAMYKALEGNADERAAQVSDDLKRLNSLITLEKDEDFSWATPPQVGADLNQLIQLTLSMINQAGIASVMRGDSPTADATGYLANQLMTAARLAYDPITDNCKFMLRDGAAYLLYGVDQLANADKTGVPVWGENEDGEKAWLVLTAHDIDGIYDTEPRLDPLLPSNLIMEGRFGLEQVRDGALSMYTHRSDFLHREAPEEEEYKILLEKAKAKVEEELIIKAGTKAGILAPAEPPPSAIQQAGMVDQFGQPMGGGNLGNTGMPVSPGMGMSLTGEQSVPGGVPALPTPIPGVVSPGNAGGNFGREMVTNA